MYKQPADHIGLPVFVYLWFWVTAQLPAPGGQTNALLATEQIVGCWLSPAEKSTADIDNTL